METNIIDPATLLTEDQEQQLRRLLDSITATVLHSLQHDRPDSLSCGIMGGDAGAVLFLFHKARFDDDEVLQEQAMMLLERLLEQAGEESGHSLFAGLPGMVWLLIYLQREGFIDEDESLISETLLDHLCEASLKMMRAAQYDYMHNGLSTAVAFLASPELVRRRTHYFEEVVAALDATAIQYRENAVYWEYLYTQTPGQGVSLGLCHGSPSVISFLGKLCQLGVAIEASQALIRKAVRFMQLHCDAGRMDCNYPSLVHPGALPPYDPTRLGWCYGDMGIAVSLIHAFNATGDKMYKQEVDRIISVMLQRKDVHRWMRDDAALCHGTWGIAHLFLRFCQYSQQQALKGQAGYWIRQSLQLTKESENGVEISAKEYEEVIWTSNVSVLNGISGVGLVILGMLADEKLSWDEVYFLDIN